jgi:uncharacterized protein YjiS (DUF1127 family)
MGSRYLSLVKGKWVGIPGGSAAMRRPKRVSLPHFQTKLERVMPAITSLTISAAAPLGRVLSGLAGRAKRALKQFAQKVKNRRDAMRLAELDDRMLSDIGLNRSDLRDAFALPPWRDPGGLLMQRVAERRDSRRRTIADCVPVTTVSAELFGAMPAPCYPRT